MWLPDLQDRRGPRYVAIADALAEAVENGDLPPGTRLPPQRELAYLIGVNLTTVTRAYALARERGLLEGEVGRGTYIRSTPAGGPTPWPDERDDGGVIDLSPNYPCRIIDDVMMAVALDGLAHRPGISRLMQYQAHSAHPSHQRAGARWLRRLGVETKPEDVLITSGALHGSFIALMAVARPGDLVLAEELTSPAIKGAASVLGVRLKGVPMDADGIVPEALEALLERENVRGLILVPNLHNPTTAVLPSARRSVIADLCERFDLAVIEDDVYGALLPERPRPLAALCPERVFYATSLSKAVAPGLRIGYMVAPAAWRPAVSSALRITTWMASPLMAELARQWIEDGTADAVVARQRRETGSRQRLIAEMLPNAELSAHPAGLNAWLRLPRPWRAGAFCFELLKRGVSVTPAESFAVDPGQAPQAVRLCLGAVEAPALRRGLEIVSGLLQTATPPSQDLV